MLISSLLVVDKVYHQLARIYCNKVVREKYLSNAIHFILYVSKLHSTEIRTLYK